MTDAQGPSLCHSSSLLQDAGISHSPPPPQGSGLVVAVLFWFDQLSHPMVTAYARLLVKHSGYCLGDRDFGE